MRSPGGQMSLIILHLRWNDVSLRQYQMVGQELATGDKAAVGCLFRQLRLSAGALLDTEVWRDETSAGRFLSELGHTVQPAGLGEPQVVTFSVPTQYAAVYERA